MRDQRVNDRMLYVMAAVIGAVAFVMIYGINVLNPVYVDWLLGKGDLTQHYLGWCFFRRGNWTFPIGLTDNLAYPSYTSVIFTDSIPLLAVFFKALSPVLPETFQYFGWWGIASFALQGYFAAKILCEFSLRRLQILIGSIYFIVSPIVIERMFRHTALGGHWLILLAIYMFIRHRKDYQNTRKMTLCWGIMGALIAAVHMYFLPMCGAFLCGYILSSFLREKRIRWNHLLAGVSFIGALLTCTYLLGGFSTRASAESDGLGECSFNLNGFFNEKGYSRFLDALPMYHGSQYEGFAYLGIGIFVLMVVAVAYMILELLKTRGGCVREHSVGIVTSILIAVGLILFAASPVVTWNDKLLFILTDSSTLTHYWSIFRSSGRIIWPVCYLIYIVVIVCNAKIWDDLFKNRNVSAAISVGMLVVCCFLQIFDIGGKLMEQRVRFASKGVYMSDLHDEVWDELAQKEGLAHCVWVSNSFENYRILEMANWAYNAKLTMNIFYFARGLSVLEDTKYSLQHPDDSYVFVFKQEELSEYLDCGLNFYKADEYVIGTTFVLEQERYKFDEF